MSDINEREKKAPLMYAKTFLARSMSSVVSLMSFDRVHSSYDYILH